MFFTIFSLLVIGAAIGWLSNLALRKKGMKPLKSIGAGIAASLFGGIIAFEFGLAGYGFYGAVSAMSVLFTIDVFINRK
tara:strand:- start:29975 stop:30211 length:237 start_codon:yes stop_codon:yes gene_type:complete